jgi:predicted O-methyltransferase YrrM
MRTIDISFRLLSEAVWQRVLEASAFELQSRRAWLFETLSTLDKLRTQAEYNTGSISSSSSWLLYSLAMYFRPAFVAEVGTFIGRSTLSMALGLDQVRTDGEIHTCDGSNAIGLPNIAKTKIVQYKKTTSTDMFGQLARAGGNAKIDFLMLDGRLQPGDLFQLGALLHKGCVIALDDFEGIEKGTANLMALRSNELVNGYACVYPCPERLLLASGFNDPTSLALLIPENAIRITAQ